MDETTRRRLRQTLENLQRAGVTHLPKARSQPNKSAPATANSPNTDQGAREDQRPATGAASPTQRAGSLFDEIDRPGEVPLAVRPRLLAQMHEEVAGCTRCPALVECRTQTVFGVGSPQPALCFVGEAPGQEEDRQGEPFVGPAGQLLNRILAACSLRREDVYILNVLKCRPPGNRTPLPSEVANCLPYLERQLDILRPQFLCALGGVAATTLLETNQSMGKLRGRFYQFRGIPLICTYHPAYLLRNPSAKRLVWEDMKLLMARMGIEL